MDLKEPSPIREHYSRWLANASPNIQNGVYPDRKAMRESAVTCGKRKDGIIQTKEKTNAFWNKAQRNLLLTRALPFRGKKVPKSKNQSKDHDTDCSSNLSSSHSK